MLSLAGGDESSRVFLTGLVFFSIWLLIFGGHWLYWKYYVDKAIKEAGDLPPLNFQNQYSVKHVVVALFCGTLSLVGLILLVSMFSLVMKYSF